LTSSQGVGLTKAAGEACVEQFIQEGWLTKSPAGFVTLSERGLMELKGYLIATFNDIEDEEGGARTNYVKTCYGCQEIITKVFHW
jgi:non-structural maintenance of chromosomes element 1